MKRFVLLLLVVFVLPTALVVGQGPEETLVRALTGGDISTLNPALISDSSSIDVASFLWDGLYQADPETVDCIDRTDVCPFAHAIADSGILRFFAPCGGGRGHAGPTARQISSGL